MTISRTSTIETNGFNEKQLYTGFKYVVSLYPKWMPHLGFCFWSRGKKNQESKILINRFRCQQSQQPFATFCSIFLHFKQNLQFGHYDPSTFSFWCCSFFKPVVLFMHLKFVMVVLICCSSAYKSFGQTLLNIRAFGIQHSVIQQPSIVPSLIHSIEKWSANILEK